VRKRTTAVLAGCGEFAPLEAFVALSSTCADLQLKQQTGASIRGDPRQGDTMKRLLALALCAIGIVCAITACGGSSGDDSTTDDKLTIVGSGS
jgi:hypothetical protein